MLRNLFSVFLLTLAIASPACAAPAAPAAEIAPPTVGFAIVKTSQVAVAQRLLTPNGSLLKKIDTNFSAFLIKHQQDYLLFDTGLGEQVDAQYQQDMPLWMRPFFKYDRPVVSVRAQLAKAGLPPIQRVILSHAHWDHASGVVDFPQAKISVAVGELANIRSPSDGGGTWASLVADPSIQWDVLSFTGGPFKGYPQSLDLYQDGTVVLVPMPGHTQGSVGLFLTVDSGAVYFFIGDVAWTQEALNAGAPKFWAASLLVDQDAAQTLSAVEHVRAIALAQPDLVVVPAHDSKVQDALGYFPKWVK